MNEGMLLNNRYQLLERLGSGGMSDVFRARDLMLERSVAIKVLHEDYSNDDAFQQRFRQGPAIDRNERRASARTMRMYRSRDEFFARARFARYQDRGG